MIQGSPSPSGIRYEARPMSSHSCSCPPEPHEVMAPPSELVAWWVGSMPWPWPGCAPACRRHRSRSTACTRGRRGRGDTDKRAPTGKGKGREGQGREGGRRLSGVRGGHCGLLRCPTAVQLWQPVHHPPSSTLTPCSPPPLPPSPLHTCKHLP